MVPLITDKPSELTLKSRGVIIMVVLLCLSLLFMMNLP